MFINYKPLATGIYGITSGYLGMDLTIQVAIL